MPSSPSNSLRLEEMFTGEQVNVWGVLLDQVIAMLDAAIAGMATIALTGNYTLTSHNYVADEARNAILKLTGAAGWTVTIPAVTKVYVVWNASSAVQTIASAGGGASATVQIGEVVLLVTDAVNVKRVQPTDFGAREITGVGEPNAATSAATKNYADNLAFTANAGILPGQPGAAGKFLTTNGAVAAWQQLTSADLSDTAARDVAATARAVALAVAL